MRPDPQPAVGVDGHGGAQHHGLGAQVVGQLQAAVYDGEREVVGPLRGLAAPQQQPLRGLGAQAQLEVVTLQRLLAGGQRAGQASPRAAGGGWARRGQMAERRTVGSRARPADAREVDRQRGSSERWADGRAYLRRAPGSGASGLRSRKRGRQVSRAQRLWCRGGPAAAPTPSPMVEAGGASILGRGPLATCPTPQSRQ